MADPVLRAVLARAIEQIRTPAAGSDASTKQTNPADGHDAALRVDGMQPLAIDADDHEVDDTDADLAGYDEEPDKTAPASGDGCSRVARRRRCSDHEDHDTVRPTQR